MKKNKSKHGKMRNNKIRIVLSVVLLVIIIVCGVWTYQYFQSNKKSKEMSSLLDTTTPPAEVPKEKTERMIKVEELQKENQDIIGWLQIIDTNIDYPVLQATDNSFYLTHDYKKEYSAYGSLFLDKDYDFNLPSSNLLIYGHRNKQGLMFEDLMKYQNEDFYKQHPTIRFTTDKEDVSYEIISVFKSRVYYKSEKNVFRYYYFVNASSEEEYNSFVEQAKQVALYDTGKSANYGEQLLTLSTCEYSQQDGRFVVVAKKIPNND